MRKFLILTMCLLIVAIGTAVYVRHTAAFTLEVRETYIVEQGDTLWAIAAKFSPRRMDVRDYIYRLRVANELTASATIHPGQELTLPKR